MSDFTEPGTLHFAHQIRLLQHYRFLADYGFDFETQPSTARDFRAGSRTAITNFDRCSEARVYRQRINHQECYSDGEACMNQAESLFSRLRRAEFGIHHQILGRYLAAYANEMAWWREVLFVGYYGLTKLVGLVAESVKRLVVSHGR